MQPCQSAPQLESHPVQLGLKPYALLQISSGGFSQSHPEYWSRVSSTDDMQVFTSASVSFSVHAPLLLHWFARRTRIPLKIAGSVHGSASAVSAQSVKPSPSESAQAPPAPPVGGV